MFNTRRTVILWLTLISTFITFMAASSGFWIHWSIFATSMFIWLILDIMFLESNNFLYEPDYRAWADKTNRD